MAKHSEIRVGDLKSYADCQEAIQEIENDYRNTAGGMKAWCSGEQTYLNCGAEKKIEAIERRSMNFNDEADD